MKGFLRTAYGLFALFLIYNIWSRSGRNFVYTGTYQSTVLSYGTDSGRGNILGMQPWFTPFDFSRPSAYYGILDFQFKQAKHAGLLNEKTIVLLPEYVGTWLVVAGEKHGVFTARELEPAMRRFVLSNLGGFALHYLRAGSDERAKEAVFRMKARYMKNIYEKTFAALAKKYQVHIVAGSIVLPGPNLVDGELRSDKKALLYNVSCLFGPDGRIRGPLVLKRYPIAEEKTFTACAQTPAPRFETPAGQLGILICADAWYASAYDSIRGADIAVGPSYVSPAGAWDQAWQGYSGFDNPDDIDPHDLGRLSEKEAWLKYSLPKFGPQFGIPAGMQVFLRGELWDLGTDGAAILYDEQGVVRAPKQEKNRGQLINLWL